MYRSLILPEGGIITKAQKAKQTKDPVVVIGIGGTGAKAMNVLKGKMKRQLEPDDIDSLVPKYEHIRFLEIDSDVEWIRNCPNIDNDEEFINLQDQKLKEKFNNRIARNNLMKKPEFNWLQIGEGADSIKVPDGLNGGGGIRQLGRYMVVNEAALIYNKVKGVITQAIRNRHSSDLIIHIMAGISGGMGSGCFIDVCYLVRKVLADLSIGGAAIFGYVFLPDVITTIPSIAADYNKITGNYRNGYAALMELDYLMNLQNNYGSFQQNYGPFTIDTQQTPVDMCHLISALDARGDHKQNAFDYSMNVVADYIMSYLSESDTKTITPKGHLVNINQGMDLLSVDKGAYNRYHILGASSAEIPMAQVATYLATGLYEKMKPYLARKAVDADVRNFVESKMNCTVSSVRRQICDGVILSHVVTAPPMDAVKAIRTPLTHSPLITKQMELWLDEQKGQIEKNYRILNGDSDYIYNVDSETMIGNAFNRLYEMATDEEFGPAYAASMLQRNGKDVNDILMDIHIEIDQKMRNAQEEEKIQERNAEEAKQKFINAKNNIFHRRNEEQAFKEYLDMISRWYSRKLDIIIYSYVEKTVMGLRQKLIDLNQFYYGKFMNVLGQIVQSIEANVEYFKSGLADRSDIDGFTMKIIGFGEIKDHLDTILSEEKPQDAAMKLTRFFLDHGDEWKTGDEYRIVNLLNDFFYHRFQSELDKSMQEYIKEKYHGMNSEQIDKALLSDLFIPLKEASEPLFWCGPNISIHNTYSNIMMSVPDTSANLTNASELFEEMEPNVQVRLCNIGDRIYMTRLYSGMALYGYHGLELMKKSYDSLSKTGVHLYGKREENWENHLMTPIPYTLNPDQYDLETDAQDVLKEAISQGIIYKNYENWELHAMDLSKHEETIHFLENMGCMGEQKEENHEVYLENKSSKNFCNQYFSEGFSDMQRALEHIEKLQHQIKDDKNQVYVIPSNGDLNIALDNVMHSPLLSKLMFEMTTFGDSLEIAHERILYLMNRKEETGRLENDFCNAMFTGVIRRGIGKIFYKYSGRKDELEVVLNSRNMQYSNFDLYQAYISYCNTDDYTRNRITQETKNRLEHLSEGDDAIAKSLKNKYSEEYFAQLEGQYRRQRNGDEIKAFYDNFNNLLSTYLEQFAA